MGSHLLENTQKEKDLKAEVWYLLWILSPEYFTFSRFPSGNKYSLTFPEWGKILDGWVWSEAGSDRTNDKMYYPCFHSVLLCLWPLPNTGLSSFQPLTCLLSGELNGSLGSTALLCQGGIQHLHLLCTMCDLYTMCTSWQNRHPGGQVGAQDVQKWHNI